MKKIKYRIKIITYKNNRTVFIPQRKQGLCWYDIMSDGRTTGLIEVLCDSRNEALRNIDLNYAGNTEVQTIDFEYITK